MKKILALLIVLAAPAFSVAQNKAVDQMQTQNLERMLWLGLCTKTMYSVYNEQQTVQTVFKFDTTGFVLLSFYASAGYNNMHTYEKDRKGYFAKQSWHNGYDTSKIDSWCEYENDSLGHRIKSITHLPDGKVYVDEITTYVDKGKEQWLFTWRYNGLDTFKTATRSHYENKRLLITDYIDYDKNDSIKEIKTYYSEYDSLGRLIEYGQLEYVAAILEYYKSFHLNPYHDLYRMPQVIFRMQLDGKFHGEKKSGAIDLYRYDALGRISYAYEMGDRLYYTYNSKNQLIEIKNDDEDKPYLVKYTYDKNGLLIRETATLMKDKSVFQELKYEYARCQ